MRKCPGDVCLAPTADGGCSALKISLGAAGCSLAARRGACAGVFSPMRISSMMKSDRRLVSR
jgi:hypothetical protein